MFDPDDIAAAEAFLAEAREKQVTVATAESCTGGLVAALLTEIAGSSAVVDRGFVTYSNAAKAEALGVPKTALLAYGAVSEPVARAMAEGAIARSRASLAVSITGIAGPGGGTADKPVGLVHFATAQRDGETRAHEERFGDIGRAEVRLATLRTALRLLKERL